MGKADVTIPCAARDMVVTVLELTPVLGVPWEPSWWCDSPADQTPITL